MLNPVVRPTARVAAVPTDKERLEYAASLIKIGATAEGMRLIKTIPAEQYPEAIRAYQDVLQQVCDFSPLNEATERLKALRKEHPEAFGRAEGAPGVAR